MKTNKPVYKNICWCGEEKNLVTVKRGGGDIHLCKKHAAKWMQQPKKNGGKR